ncbi:allantoate deiminase [Bacillus swezeyi]|uniref:allantoate deiminase n=1 Tax=Bacillus swezeyi TaxID=1925020 RepID=UPI002E24B7B2|nr:allantoate deiminase [Bacillus swezeyi]MED2943769.1 allantoate deiminase [Bacillus swezeyi]MED2978767.1 allantoate deiminase [Bacillus swezeyi]
MIKNEMRSPALSEQIEETVEWLASFGKTDNNGVTRPLYTDDWLFAQKAVEQRMNEIGLNAYFDDVGNLFGRLEGTLKEEGVILTGSHIDTVVNGGKYDGAYGVVAGLIALQYLKEEYGYPKKNIEVVSLCEEEGSRFPMTYWGSGSIVGIKSVEDIQNLKDSKGTPFFEAMKQAGFGQGKYRNSKRNDLNCFIELHVEQGQVLELEGKSIGLVSHIVGQKRFTITVTGESNHAGTTPMNYRKDAMHAATEMIYSLLQKAKETSPDLVCTVGQITLDPNIPNVIPGKATFSIDTRHPDEEVLASFCDEVFKEFTTITNSYKTQLHIDNWMNEKPVKMSEQLNKVTESILTKEKFSFKKMTSGAGHDSQILGQYCPTSLLFVPSHKGMSHSPFEYTSTEDLERGIHLLIKVLHELAY